MVPCPRGCRGAANCDVCWGAGEVAEERALLEPTEPFASVTDLEAVDPTKPMSREEIDAVLASTNPPPPLESELLDDIPDEEPTRPSTPDAKRRSTPFPK